MKQLLGIALILAIGFVVSHRWFGKARVWIRGHLLYLTGGEFLLLGFVLGPRVTNVIDEAMLLSLEPFVGLGLGYIGFVFGMQFRLRDLVEIPRRYLAATACQNLVSVAVLVPALAALLRPLAEGERLAGLVLGITATAVGTSTAFLFLVERNTRLGRSDVFRFMRFSSVFDDLFGVLLFGVALCLMRGGTGGGWAPVQWFGVSVAVGLVSGVFLQLSATLGLDDREDLLFLMGLVLFSGGLAAYFRLSPVFTNLVAAFFFCNRCRQSRSYHDLLLRVEKPVYLLMLILAGALWQIRFDGVLPVLALYVGFRSVGKHLGARAAGALLARDGASVPAFGLGLAAQSEMAVAMLVNLLVVTPDQESRLAVGALFLAVGLNDVIASGYFATARTRGQ